MKLNFWKKETSDKTAELTKLLATREHYFDNIISGWNELIENPNKILREQGIGLNELERLTYDAHVSSCIQSRKAGVLSLDWEITESKDTRINKLLDAAFSELDIRTIISEMLDAPLYGFVPLEIYWELNDIGLLPYDIVSKPSWWFKWDKYNLLRFMKIDKAEGLVCPPKKFLTVRYNPRFNNPYGEPILAKCFYPVLFKKESLKLWSIFASKYGMPFIVGETEFDKKGKLLMDALMKLQADSITVAPEGTKVNFLQPSGASGDNYNLLIDFLNREISKLLLSQTLSSEQGESGSYALGKAHLDVRESVVESDKSLVEAAFNKLISWIVEVNIGEVPELPKFILYKPADVDKNLADRDKVLYDMGLRFKETYYKVAYGFKDGDFEIKEETEPTEQLPNEMPNDIKGTVKFSESNLVPEIALDDFTDANDTMIKPILKMINEAKSYDEIQQELIKMFPELNTDKIEDLLAKGILIANYSLLKEQKG